MTNDATVLENWVRDVLAALELPADSPVDVAVILDLARVAAHGVTRPAAPLTTFIAGYAAALNGGSAADVAEAVRKIVAITPEPVVTETAEPSPAADGR